MWHDTTYDLRSLTLPDTSDVHAQTSQPSESRWKPNGQNIWHKVSAHPIKNKKEINVHVNPEIMKSIARRNLSIITYCDAYINSYQNYGQILTR